MKAQVVDLTCTQLLSSEHNKKQGGTCVMSKDSLLDTVSIVSSRLRSLLSKARIVKPSTSIEPALSSPDFANDVQNIADSPERSNDQLSGSVDFAPTKQTAFEIAAREILYETIGNYDVRDAGFVDVWNLLDLLQICAAQQQQCDSGLALWLVEEMLDSQTIEGCRYILDYLKSRRAQLIDRELSRNKSNTILRTCNELLRRLSRAEDAVFCGDVFVFLFQVFPLGDKSAVNLRGEFHVENTTTFDPEPDDEVETEVVAPNEEQRNGDAMQIDTTQQTGTKSDNVTQGAGKHNDDLEVQPSTRPSYAKDGLAKDPSQNEKTKVEVPDSRTLYSTFWSLQHIFSNPTKSFDTEAFAGFKKGLELAFTKFKATPKVPRVTAQSRKRKREEGDSDFASTFNPKYLTSRDLFDLELSDLMFQRHILVQAMILLDFLLSLTPDAKKKTEGLKAQKSMIYNYTLSEADTKWCLDMRRAISQYLQEGPDGKLYHRMVDNVLSRDKNWVAWKVESCQDISRPSVSFADYVKAEDGIKRICAPRRMKAAPMGSLNLDFLDENNRSISLNKLRDPSRHTRPTTEALIQEAQNIDLDLEMVEKETSPEEWAGLVTKRSSKTWRTLRLEAKKRLALFPKIDETQNIGKLIEPEETPPADGELETAGGENEDKRAEPTLVQDTGGAPTGDTGREHEAAERNDTNGIGVSDTATG